MRAQSGSRCSFPAHARGGNHPGHGSVDSRVRAAIRTRDSGAEGEIRLPEWRLSKNAWIFDMRWPRCSPPRRGGFALAHPFDLDPVSSDCGRGAPSPAFSSRSALDQGRVHRCNRQATDIRIARHAERVAPYRPCLTGPLQPPDSHPWIGLDPVRSRSTEPDFRRGGGGTGQRKLHVHPRLTVGNVLARQAATLCRGRIAMLSPTAPSVALEGKGG